MPRKSKVRLTERDYKIFRFLWRWKYVSTKALSSVFFNGLYPTVGYSRLRQLKNAGFIKLSFIDPKIGQAWTLALKGFKEIEEYLPPLENPGFKGEHPKHDFLVSAVHIGDWLLGSPEGSSLFSEQQLRRYSPEFYPDWIPECDYYRPDGYWYIENPEKPPRILTLEVELTQKSYARYEKVSDFFKLNPQVTTGVWVVPNRASALRLMNTLSPKNQKSPSPHQFFLVDDILKLNWDSKVVLGSKKDQSLKNIMTVNGQLLASICPVTLLGRDLVNTKISLKLPEAYKASKKSKISD